MINLIIAVIVITILAAAIIYIVKAKKNGTKCIGCPAAGTCKQNHDHSRSDCGCGPDCSCHYVSETKKEKPVANMAVGNVCAAKINNAERK